MSSTTVFMGNSVVEVRFDYERAQIETRDDPGFPEDCQITDVCINGEWVGTDYFTQKWLDHAAQAVLERMDDDRDDAQIDAAEWKARDRFIEGYDA